MQMCVDLTVDCERDFGSIAFQIYAYKGLCWQVWPEWNAAVMKVCYSSYFAQWLGLKNTARQVEDYLPLKHHGLTSAASGAWAALMLWSCFMWPSCHFISCAFWASPSFSFCTGWETSSWKHWMASTHEEVFDKQQHLPKVYRALCTSAQRSEDPIDRGHTPYCYPIYRLAVPCKSLPNILHTMPCLGWYEHMLRYWQRVKVGPASMVSDHLSSERGFEKRSKGVWSDVTMSLAEMPSACAHWHLFKQTPMLSDISFKTALSKVMPALSIILNMSESLRELGVYLGK